MTTQHPPRNESGRPWDTATIADIEAGGSVRNADRVREVFATPEPAGTFRASTYLSLPVDVRRAVDAWIVQHGGQPSRTVGLEVTGGQALIVERDLDGSTVRRTVEVLSPFPEGALR